MFLNFKIPNRFKHECELPKDKWAPCLFSPYDSWYQRIWHQILMKATIWDTTESRQYFRSNCAFLREQQRHLFTPRKLIVVHPFSQMILVKKFIISILWIITFCIESFCGSFAAVPFFREGIRPVHVILIVLNALYFLDIFTRFIIGFANLKTREVILDHKIITKRYLQTFFIFDLVPIVTFFTSVFVLRSYVVKIIVFECHLLRLARVYTIIENMELVFSVKNISRTRRIMITFSIFFAIFVHESTCLLGWFVTLYEAMGKQSGQTWYEQHASQLKQVGDLRKNMTKRSFDYYLHYYSLVASHFFGCGPYRYKIQTPTEMFIMSIITVMGLLFYLYAVALILEILQVLHISDEKYEELLAQTNDLMVRRRFPRSTVERVYTYFDYKYDKKFFSEQRILDSLSEHLRLEVLLYRSRGLVSDIKVAKSLTKATVGALLSLIKPEIYLKDDVLMCPEDSNNTMFFILHGTCTVLTQNGRELTHEEDGDRLVECVKLDPKAVIYFPFSVVAVEVMEVYEMSLNDLRICCRKYPDLKAVILNMVGTRAKVYNRLYAIREQDENITDEIVDQLRARRILRLGPTRQQFMIKTR